MVLSVGLVVVVLFVAVVVVRVVVVVLAVVVLVLAVVLVVVVVIVAGGVVELVETEVEDPATDDEMLFVVALEVEGAERVLVVFCFSRSSFQTVLASSSRSPA